jgi:cupin fold WbuC family metalloprotein
MTRTRLINNEVFVAEDRLVAVDRPGLEPFHKRALESTRHRARLCAHKQEEDRIHEMFIALTKEAYIRPHRHLNKSESFHVIEGSADVIFFSDIGAIEQVIVIGEYRSGKPFYYRNEDERFHTQIVTSERLIFHETTNGPFRRFETVLAPWSPDESDPQAVKAYLDALRGQVAQWNEAARRT